MSNDDLKATIQELKDIQDIKQLKSRYCHHVDTANWDELDKLWTEDALCDYAFFGSYKGREDIMGTFFRGLVANASSFNAHMLHNPVIEVDGDNALAKWYVTAHTTVQPLNQAVLMLGVYDDQYQRVDGIWKISSTKVEFKYFTPFEEGWAKTPFWEQPE